MRKGDCKTLTIRAVENGYQVQETEGFDRGHAAKGHVAIDDDHLMAVIADILDLEDGQ